MKFHNDPIAVKYTFYEILNLSTTQNASDLIKMKELRNRCLEPGLYAKHMRYWLNEFPSRQLHMVDGSELKKRPHESMLKLQKFMKVKIIDFKSLLVFSDKKMQFCLIESSENGRNACKCLGVGKGRKYANIDDDSRNYLENFYIKANIDFYKLLKRRYFEIPSWLRKII